MRLPFRRKDPRRFIVVYQSPTNAHYQLSVHLRKQEALDLLSIFKDAVLVVEVVRIKQDITPTSEVGVTAQ